MRAQLLSALGYSANLKPPGLLDIKDGANVSCELDRTLFAGKSGLEQAKQAVTSYKKGEVKEMTPELWQAKKIVDSTLHPGIYHGRGTILWPDC